MDKLIELLGKLNRILDQIGIGRERAASNLDMAIKIADAVRSADIGNDTNRLIDAVTPVLQKARSLVAPPAQVNAQNVL